MKGLIKMIKYFTIALVFLFVLSSKKNTATTASKFPFEKKQLFPTESGRTRESLLENMKDGDFNENE